AKRKSSVNSAHKSAATATEAKAKKSAAARRTHAAAARPRTARTAATTPPAAAASAATKAPWPTHATFKTKTPVQPYGNRPRTHAQPGVAVMCSQVLLQPPLHPALQFRVQLFGRCRLFGRRRRPPSKPPVHPQSRKSDHGKG